MLQTLRTLSILSFHGELDSEGVGALPCQGVDLDVGDVVQPLQREGFEIVRTGESCHDRGAVLVALELLPVVPGVHEVETLHPGFAEVAPSNIHRCDIGDLILKLIKSQM